MSAPAQFLRITPETELTVPCVLAKEDAWRPGEWKGMVAINEQVLLDWIDAHTHWLPIQFPEVRG